MTRNAGHDWLMIGAAALPETLHRPGVRLVAPDAQRPPAFARAARKVTRDQGPIDVFWSPRHHLPGLDVPMVVTIHDLTWRLLPATMRPTRWLSEALAMPRSLRRAAAVIAVSEHTANDLIRCYPGLGGRIHMVYPGVDHLPAAVPTSTGDGDGDRPSVLFVGTFEPRKNLRRLLQAYARVVESGSRHRLVLAGQPGWRVDVAGLIRRLGLQDHVLVDSSMDDAALAARYAAADFLVLPALYEGFGLPIGEAMSFGKPVITSRTASMPEAAGDAGLLVDPYDVADIAQALQQLMTDRALHHRLSGQARASASRFRWANAAQKTLEILERTAAGRGASD